MKQTGKIRIFLPLVILILLAGALVYRHFAYLPLIWPGQSITVSVCDGENVTWKLVYQNGDMFRLLWKISTSRAAAAKDWTAPEDPWPVYGISVSRTNADFEAVVCDGVWVDCNGRTLATGLDFSALWEEFEGTQHTREGIGTIPCRQKLALRDGSWNPQFLVPASRDEPMSDVVMELTGENLAWTITNRGDRTVYHGNGAGAGLQILLDGTWYGVPEISWMNYSVTAEEYELKPGASYSDQITLKPYGDLPSGSYRIVFFLSQDDREQTGYAAARFSIREDGTFTQESPAST